MDNKLFMAVGLSLLVLFLLMQSDPPVRESADLSMDTTEVASNAGDPAGETSPLDQHQPAGEDDSQAQSPQAQSPQAPPPSLSGESSPWAALPAVGQSPPDTVTVTTPLYEAVFSAQGAMTLSWRLMGSAGNGNYREIFQDPRYLSLRNSQRLGLDPWDLRGWILPLRKPTDSYQAFKDYKTFHNLAIDHLTYREYMAYKSGERGDVEVRGGLTDAPVRLVDAALTWPFVGLAGEWGIRETQAARNDETILYTPSASSLDVTSSPRTLTFTAAGGGLRLEKEFTFVPDDYSVSVVVRIKNEGDEPMQWNGADRYRLVWRGGLGRPSTAYDLLNSVQIGWANDVEFMQPGAYESIQDELTERGLVLPSMVDVDLGEDVFAASRQYDRADVPVHWVVVDNKYFAAAIIPRAPGEKVTLGLDYVMGRGGDTYLIRPEAGIVMPMLAAIPPGGSREDPFQLYVGPKDEDRLDTLDPTGDLVQIKQVTFASLVRPITRVMMWFLRLLHGFVPNYGICIVLLTLVVKALMFPLYHKQQVSMKRMQAMQPQINALKEQYKNDPQRLQRETMEFYKRNKINPAAGCLMMLPMMPIFIALWVTFNKSLELRGEPFLWWIDDLSKPDNAFFVPVLGWIIPINVLPLAYALAMYWSQSRQQMPDNPNANAMKFIPFIFIFFFWNFASGVILYFVVGILIDTLQRLLMDVLGIGNVSVPAAAPAGGGGNLSLAQDDASATATSAVSASPEAPSATSSPARRKSKRKRRG